MEHGLVTDIALCIIAAWVVAVLCQAVKQPLLIAYLVAGFAIGPNGFRWVINPDSIETIASIGLMLLLFMIGLEMDLKTMLSAGKAITATAAVQIFGCVALGWFFFKITGLGGAWLEALYLAVAAAMSSTVIIIKILHDKRELETLPGRITVGILVLQDLAIILFLAAQPYLGSPNVAPLVLASGKVLLLVGVAYGVSRFLLPPLFGFVARQPELVLVGALAWCFAMAGLAGVLHLSREMGALIAGVMLSTFPYTLDIVAKVTNIRDFFVTLFFVSLGMTIPVPTLPLMIGLLAFSAFVIVTRFVTVFAPLYRMRLGFRSSLLPAINLAQMSELSLVLLALGKTAGEVSQNAVSVAALAFALLAVGSTYAILRNDRLLRRAAPWFRRLGLRDLSDVGEDTARMQKSARTILLGFSWTASSLLEEITRERPALLQDLLVVDFNPLVNRRLRARGVRVAYGDISDRDVLVHAGVPAAEILICSLPDTVLKGVNNRKLLRQLRELNCRAQIIVHAEKLADIPELYAAGASYVTAPRLLEAMDLMQALEVAGKNLLDQKRKEQGGHLAERNEVIP